MKDFAYIIPCQRLEHYYLIDTVQKFRSDGLPEHLKNLLLTFIQQLRPLGNI